MGRVPWDVASAMAQARAMRGHGMPTFQGDLYQRGYGIGGLLTSLMRKARPIIMPLIKKVGKSLLSTGGKVAKDVIFEKRGLKKALRQRGSEALANLLQQPGNKTNRNKTNRKRRKQQHHPKKHHPIKRRRKTTHSRDIFN